MKRINLIWFKIEVLFANYRYSVYRNLIFIALLLLIVLSIAIFLIVGEYGYSLISKWLLPIIFSSTSLFFMIVILIKQWIEFRSIKFDIFHRFHKYKNYTALLSSLVSSIILLFSTSLTVFLLIKNNKSDQIIEFIPQSSIVVLALALFFGIYSLIYTVIVSRQQRYELYGFENFLEELKTDLVSLNQKATSNNSDDTIFEVVIVDFHPFIGSKSLGTHNPFFKSYLNVIEDIASNRHIDLSIVCHTKEIIETSFNTEDKIHNLSKNNILNNLTVEKAINKLEEQNNVHLWRTKHIGPHHFILINKEIAYEYLVVPFHNYSNKNVIIGTKHIDQSKVTHIHKAYHDIISATIKPKELDLSSSKKKDDVYDTANQNNIKGIKLRFQFEEKEDRNRNPIINGKKGNFPIYNLKEIPCTFYVLDEHFKIEKIANTSSSGINEVYVTHNITEHISKYAELFSFAVDSLNATFPMIEKEHKGMNLKFHFDSASNIYKLEEMIFKFNDNDIYLEHRTFSKCIADKVFYKIKIIKENELIESEYSYKSTVIL